MTPSRPPATEHPTADAPPPSFRLAAIDVGSNSVHMVVAQADDDGGLTTLWRMKEMVGLGRISFPSRVLSPAAMDRAVASLSRMRQAARQREAEKIVAVATSAIREADNGGDLIERIKRDLRLKVRVVSAREEARLIYLGVRSAIDLDNKPHLIVDVGGGSVEFVIGDASEAKLLESRKLGAARMTAQFIAHDPPLKAEIAALREHYVAELSPLIERFKSMRPTKCIGTSGTLENIAGLCGGAGQTPPVIEQIKLKKLEQRLISMSSAERAAIAGLDDQRRTQIVAGVTLVSTFMSLMSLKRIEICSAALREGLLHDYLSRHIPDLQIRRDVPDPRRRSVLDLARRCNWQESHSRHVAGLTLAIYDALVPLHALPTASRELVEYGALLHDIGWHISADRHHRHGEYLIRHASLPAFSPREIDVLAGMVRFHRKATPSSKKHRSFANLTGPDRRTVAWGSAMLRVADALDRSRASSVGRVKIKIEKKRITITVASPGDIQLELWTVRQKCQPLADLTRREIVFRSA